MFQCSRVRNARGNDEKSPRGSRRPSGGSTAARSPGVRPFLSGPTFLKGPRYPVYRVICSSSVCTRVHSPEGFAANKNKKKLNKGNSTRFQNSSKDFTRFKQLINDDPSICACDRLSTARSNHRATFSLGQRCGPRSPFEMFNVKYNPRRKCGKHGRI